MSAMTVGRTTFFEIRHRSDISPSTALSTPDSANKPWGQPQQTNMSLTFEELKTSWRDQEAVLRDLFDNKIDLEIAAQKLAAIVLPKPPSDQDDDNEDDDTMAYIEGMWNIIIGTLEEDPSRAQRVSDLIVCISQLPPVITQSGKQLCEDSRCVWQDVPRLGMALRDEWSSKSPFSIPGCDEHES
jgi:hypothetical protein